jgi:hypothetical protein
VASVDPPSSFVLVFAHRFRQFNYAVLEVCGGEKYIEKVSTSIKVGLEYLEPPFKC